MPMYMDPAGTGKLKPGLKQGAIASALLTRATITAINADGFSALDSSPPSGAAYNPALDVVVVQRDGFDTTGAAIKVTDTIPLTVRMQQIYPNQNILEPSRAVLASRLLPTDVVQGVAVANNAPVAMPIPVVKFVGSKSRSIVGNTIPADAFDAIAAHYSARKRKQIACFICTATDKNGLSTAPIVVTSTVVAASPLDKNPVPVWRPTGPVDITALAEGPIAINGRAIPWIGVAASVADSSTGTADTRGFVPQVLFKSLALSNARPLAYVQAGAAGTPQVSTNDATAYANPFPDVGSAFVALRSFTSNNLSGCIIYLMAGTQTVGSTGGFSYTSSGGEVIITRDPRTTADQAILSITANTTIPADYLRLKEVTYLFSGFFYLSPNGAAPITIENCISRAPNAQITQRPLRIHGLTLGSGGVASSATTMILVRGVAGTYTSLDPNAVVGNTFVNSTVTTDTAVDNYGMVSFNSALKQARTFVGIGSTADINGFGFLQNVVEYTDATTQTYSVSFSSDGKTGNMTHVVSHNNTLAGAGPCGRGNILYDEKQGTVRTHRFCSFKGNIHTQINAKGATFVGTNGNGNANPTDAPTHIGNLEYRYGSGCDGEVAMYPTSAGDQNGAPPNLFGQDFAGINARDGATMAARIDPKFANPQCTTYNGSSYVAGAGSTNPANYALLSGSPCASLLSEPVLEFDFAGNPRKAANDSSGAYVVAA